MDGWMDGWRSCRVCGSPLSIPVLPDKQILDKLVRASELFFVRFDHSCLKRRCVNLEKDDDLKG
jgi:hypothetical protein